MRNVIYKVSFEVNPLLDGEFDFKEEALAWANDHLADKPVVKAVDIEYSDEFGGEPIIHEEEEIFHYPVENVISDEDEDYLAARLAELERDALEADPYGADEFDGHEEFKEDTLSETDQVAVNCVDAHGELKEEAELIEADDKNDKNLVSKETLLQLKKLFGSENLEEANNEKVQPGEFEKAIKDFADYLDKDIPAIDPSKKVQPSELEKTIKDFGDYLGKDIGNEIPASSSRKKVQPGEFEKTIKDIADSLQEDVILFDPFGCDFSDCKPMEVCADEHRADCCVDIKQAPVDFLKELAAELGLEDEVEISEKEYADGSCEEKHEDEIPCEDCKDEISKVSDEAKVEEPVVVEDEVKVDVAPEAEVAAEEDIVPEEVKANEEPNVEVQVEDEKPAEEISKCHVCPECGKEICECGNKELVEKNKVTYTTGDPAIGDAHFNGAFEGGEGCSENLEENKVLTDYVQGEMAKGKSAEEVAETDEFKELAKEEAKKELSEESHPDEAQPEVDMKKAFNDALKVAKSSNKPVIYGYMGSDHHGGNRYFEIEHVVCDDLAQCRDEVMKKYHPNGSVLVAYPDKDFAEKFDPRNCDLENKELFIEDKEMSDKEFAEALKKGLEEKHCQK